MRLDLAFRLSSYLTLILSCLCLGYAEWPFIDGSGLITAGAIALLAVSFWVERRWTLSLGAANFTGFVIFAVLALWITSHVFAFEDLPPSYGPLVWLLTRLHEFGGPLLKNLPFPLGQLPYFGILLMVLLVVQTLRPKRVRDYFLLHWIGLMQVALGCVLASEPPFAGLLLLYLASGAWFLGLFYQQREHFLCAPAGKQGAAPLPFVVSGWSSLFQAGRWALAIGVVAMLLFLTTPRLGQSQWNPLHLAGDPSSAPAVVGLSEVMDLTRTGRVEMNDEIAFLVYVEYAQGKPKLDLDPDQRWRGAVLDHYEVQTGRWQHGGYGRVGLMPPMAVPDRPNPPVVPRFQPVPQTGRLPNLGPRQFIVSFRINQQEAGGLVLAEPVRIDGLEAFPVVHVAPRVETASPYFVRYFGTLIPAANLPHGDQQYQQVTRPLEEPDLGPPVAVPDEYIQRIAVQQVPGMQGWTNQLLDRLAAAETFGLTPADVAPAAPTVSSPGRLPRDRWEKVARALTAHLARSGEYTYTLVLRRKDTSIDPTLDFLANVKEGHCERFASALALMLRSQGIPARVVKGFRGADNHDDGRYDVRHSHAHSWVEALVPRTDAPGRTQWHWLMLEPTTNLEGPSAEGFSLAAWWDKVQKLGPELWKSFLMDYNSDQQDRLADGLSELFGLNRAGTGADGSPSGLAWPWLLVLVPLGGFAVWWRRRRRTRTSAASGRAVAVAFYARLLAILARRRRLKPDPAQTPREFALAAQEVLRPVPGPLANLPAQVADLFYRVRFGQQPLDADELRSLDRRLDELDAALAAA